MIDQEIAKWRSRKNRKKWCKGKVGVKHKLLPWERKEIPIWTTAGKYSPMIWFQTCCGVCGKKFSEKTRPVEKERQEAGQARDRDDDGDEAAR